MQIEMKKWRMKPETRTIVSETYKFCEEMNETYQQRVTVRQIYYHLFSRGVIQLTQKDYQKVCHILTEARKRGYISFDWIEDRSRNSLWTMLYGDIGEFLPTIVKNYRRDTWRNQENFVIILIEKEALAPIVWEIAKAYNVFVFPTKGFSSWSMFVGDIRILVEYFGKDKNLVVLTLSDLDPTGESIKEDYKQKFEFMEKELGFRKPNDIEKIALTKEQVQKYRLPPMEKKYKNGVLEIWELDALDPKMLRSVVKEEIEKYLDLDQLNADLETEKEEINYLSNIRGLEELG